MSAVEDDKATESEYDGKPLGQYWREQIDHASQVFATWESRATQIVERYRDERPLNDRLGSKFNILWSNVQVLRPSLYGRPAKPEVSRRYMDSDPVGRLASTILERCLDYEVEQFPDFHSTMDSCVEDRLLCGRGTPWMRFEGFDENGAQITSSEESQSETISEAHAPVDYVYWKDFRHSPARTWDEVWWCARRVFQTTAEGVKRFGEIFRTVPLGEYQEDNSKRSRDKSHSPQFAKKAEVWEIWNKRTGTVCWIAKDFLPALDERPDPLQLEEFFPCPKPLFATTTNGSLIPIPDYAEYQDQAQELDDITARIDHLVDAVRAAGVCNGEFKELQRLLQTKGNVLVPVENWAGFSEKGGLEGAFQLIDLTTIVAALNALYTAREGVKQIIYEICGISDILRGSSKAEETLGAQQLKANFGSLRLRSSQQEVARFASDIFKLKAQIICNLYPPMLMVQMSNIMALDEAEDPAFMQKLAAALDLLQGASPRDFHIAVESDSLAQIDDDAEKTAATEAVTVVGKFLGEAIPAVETAPQLLPMFSEMLLFLVRRYRAGRPLESAIESSMKQLAAAAAAPKGPSEEQVKAQMQMQADQMRVQADTQAAQLKEQFAAQSQTAKLQAEGQLEQLKMQMEQQRAAQEAAMEAQAAAAAADVEMRKAALDAETKLRMAELDRQTKLEIANVQVQAATSQAQMNADTTMKTTEMNNAVKMATAKPPEDPKQKAAAEMPAKQLDAQTQVRVAELEKESTLGSSAMDAAGSMFAMRSKDEPAAKPTPAAPPEPKKPSRWKIVRGEDGKIAELVAAT